MLPRNVFQMAATSVIRFNPDSKNFLDQPNNRGKVRKVAVTVVMRKLVNSPKCFYAMTGNGQSLLQNRKSGEGLACGQTCGQIREIFSAIDRKSRIRP